MSTNLAAGRPSYKYKMSDSLALAIPALSLEDFSRQDENEDAATTARGTRFGNVSFFVNSVEIDAFERRLGSRGLRSTTRTNVMPRAQQPRVVKRPVQRAQQPQSARVIVNKKVFIIISYSS